MNDLNQLANDLLGGDNKPQANASTGGAQPDLMGLLGGLLGGLQSNQPDVPGGASGLDVNDIARAVQGALGGRLDLSDIAQALEGVIGQGSPDLSAFAQQIENMLGQQSDAAPRTGDQAPLDVGAILGGLLGQTGAPAKDGDNAPNLGDVLGDLLGGNSDTKR
jgi:hypothetical protein